MPTTRTAQQFLL